MKLAISRKKFVLFALMTMALVTVLGMTAVLAADLVLHQRAERSAGTNRWGYRGPVVPRKQPNEIRLVMLGGSTVFGYGVLWNESIPALLEQRLNQQRPERTWTVINLGYNTEGAFSFLPNLQDFAYLDYDIVVLYEGYNDLLGDLSPNYTTVRQQSPIFRATGYFPILPLWLREKSMMLGADGDVSKAYRAKVEGSDKTVFRPSLAARAGASALGAAASVGEAFSRQFEMASNREQHIAASKSGGAGCPAPWMDYCESQRRAIQYGLDRGKKVLVVSQPELPFTPKLRFQQQQDALTDMLSRVFRGTDRVAHFTIGDRVNLEDTDLSFDHMHLGVDGNRLVAEFLTEPVVTLALKP